MFFVAASYIQETSTKSRSKPVEVLGLAFQSS
jgi:hypothetical protein